MSDDPSTRIAALLHEVGETHHTVYRMVDGDDPDWASWYADWLTNLSELPQILETTPVRSELTWLLVSLDRDYGAAKSERRGRSGTPSGSSRTSLWLTNKRSAQDRTMVRSTGSRTIRQ
jgi:hypothetical protein